MGLLQMIVQMALDATGFQTGLKQTQSAARQFGNDLKSQLGGAVAGVFSLAAAEEGIRRTVEFGSKIQDLSDRTGIATDDLQIFDYAARMAGSSLESVVGATEKLGIALAKARKEGPSSDIFQSLTRLGLSAEQIGSASAAEGFRLVGDSIKDVGEISGQMQSDMRDAMGKGALDVLGVLRNDIRATGEELRNLNGIIDEKNIEKLDQLDDSITKLGASLRGIAGQTVGGLDWVVEKWVTHMQASINAIVAGATLKNPIEAYKEVWATTAQMDMEEAERKAESKKKKKSYSIADTVAEENKKKQDARDLEDTVKIFERIDTIKRKSGMRSVDDAAKLKQLNEEIIGLELKAASALTDKEAAQSMLKIAELESDREELLSKKSKEKSNELVLRSKSDSNVSIGNILGVDPNRPVVDKLETMTIVLREIKDEIGGTDTVGSIFPDS